MFREPVNVILVAYCLRFHVARRFHALFLIIFEIVFSKLVILQARYFYHLLKELKLTKKIFILILLSFFSLMTKAASHYTSGTITNLTVGKAGLMIKVSGGLPDNCDGTPYNWILIKQADSALTSVVLALYISKSTSGTFYTTGRENEAGYCTLNQFDPSE